MSATGDPHGMGASPPNGDIVAAIRPIGRLARCICVRLSTWWTGLRPCVRRRFTQWRVGRVRGVRTLGSGGERTAERRLQQDGYRPMLRNAKLAGVEVDLVMLAPDEHTVVIVEVKSRSRTDVERALPREDQRRRLRRAALALRRRWPGCPVRGDVVLVLHDGAALRIEHRVGEILSERGAAPAERVPAPGQ